MASNRRLRREGNRLCNNHALHATRCTTCDARESTPRISANTKQRQAFNVNSWNHILHRAKRGANTNRHARHPIQNGKIFGCYKSFQNKQARTARLSRHPSNPSRFAQRTRSPNDFWYQSVLRHFTILAPKQVCFTINLVSGHTSVSIVTVSPAYFVLCGES